MSTTKAAYSVVVPTIGRPSLPRLLDALSGGTGPAPAEVLVVDDRPPGRHGVRRDPLPVSGSGASGVSVLQSGGRGPAAARNVGWRTATSPWVVFVDDDVVPQAGWRGALADDLDDLPWLVAGSQGRLRVPLPAGRRPTDWERNVAGLSDARWITADMAYRRDVLEEVGGFDERFLRAFREDADLGLRVTGAGYLIVAGARRVDHPVRPAGPWVSVRLQAGNADDVAMRVRHGAGWRLAAGAEPARNARHLLATVGGTVAVAAAVARRPRLASAAALAWAVATSELAVSRIRPGPRTAQEIATMLATSAAIPPAAVWHRLGGWMGARAFTRDISRAPLGLPRSPLALQPPAATTRRSRRARAARVDVGWAPKALLFDRDGTLVVDLPGNTDPDRVVLMPGARVAVARARQAGLAVGVVTNQSAIGRGLSSRAQVDAVNGRVDELLGGLDTWQVCPHAPDDGCACRKPRPGLIHAAAAELGLGAADCAVVGDIGRDVVAAGAAGARSVLVPTPVTRAAEIEAAEVVAPDLLRAVDLILAGMC